MAKKMAVIDIGSNAVRLAIGSVTNDKTVKLIQKLRVPLRFGTDAFELGLFSEATKAEALTVFSEMSKHIKRHNVTKISAVATSAFRDSKNSRELTKKIAEHTGIKIKTITGDHEARLVFQAVQSRLELRGEKSVLIDIGGGSTEVIYAEGNKIKRIKSFDIGTVRLFRLAQLQNENGNQAIELINHFKSPIIEFIHQLPIDSETLFIGTGGNLRRMGKLRKSILRKTSIDHLRYDEFRSIYRALKLLSPIQIQQNYNLRHDRSEVIVPAMRLVKVFFKAIDAHRIEVPNVGLINALFYQKSLSS